MRWLVVGDAPSCYFFAQTKATCACETLHCICLADGSIIEEDGFLQGVEAFYMAIYAKDAQIQLNEIERLRMLQHVSNRISELERSMFDILPTMEEVEVVLQDF